MKWADLLLSSINTGINTDIYVYQLGDQLAYGYVVLFGEGLKLLMQLFWHDYVRIALFGHAFSPPFVLFVLVALKSQRMNC